MRSMSMTVVPILSTLAGSGRARGGCAPAGWLLWETTTAVATAGDTIAVASAIASVETIVRRLLLLCRGVYVGWGLLVNSHAELLDVH